MVQEKKGKLPSSAEELNDYVHIATPSVWMILLAVGIFAAGMIFWSFTAALRTTVSAVAVSRNGKIAVSFPAEAGGSVKAGNKVLIGDQEYVLQSVQDEPVRAADYLTKYEYLLIHADADTSVCVGTVSGTLEEGSYNASIVTEENRPIEFLFRRGAQ